MDTASVLVLHGSRELPPALLYYRPQYIFFFFFTLYTGVCTRILLKILRQVGKSEIPFLVDRRHILCHLKLYISDYGRNRNARRY